VTAQLKCQQKAMLVLPAWGMIDELLPHTEGQTQKERKRLMDKDIHQCCQFSKKMDKKETAFGGLKVEKNVFFHQKNM